MSTEPQVCVCLKAVMKAFLVFKKTPVWLIETLKSKNGFLIPHHREFNPRILAGSVFEATSETHGQANSQGEKCSIVMISHKVYTEMILSAVSLSLLNLINHVCFYSKVHQLLIEAYKPIFKMFSLFLFWLQAGQSCLKWVELSCLGRVHRFIIDYFNLHENVCLASSSLFLLVNYSWGENELTNL